MWEYEIFVNFIFLLMPMNNRSSFDNRLDIMISPSSVKLIKPESKQASNVGDNNIPFYKESRSATLDFDQGLM